MSEERDFEAILDGLFNPTPEQRVDALATAIRQQRDRFDEKIAEERRVRRELAGRLHTQERLTNHLIMVLTLFGAYFAGVASVEAWKEGEWWDLIVVISLAVIVYLPLREIYGAQRK